MQSRAVLFRGAPVWLREDRWEYPKVSRFVTDGILVCFRGSCGWLVMAR